MLHLSTRRMVLRELTSDDAPFVLELMNEPAYHRHIGDRGLRTVADAARYVDERLRPSYAEHGHGFLVAERREDGAPLGICGLARRPWLDGPDLGYAFLARHNGQGYAREAATAVLAAGAPRGARVLAVVAPDNERSIRLLEDLEFEFERLLSPPEAEQPLALFAREPAPEPVHGVEAAAEGDYACPSCGERIVVPLDVVAGAAQEYVEDCPVCCSPNVLCVHFDEDGVGRVDVLAE